MGKGLFVMFLRDNFSHFYKTLFTLSHENIALFYDSKMLSII